MISNLQHLFHLGSGADLERIKGFLDLVLFSECMIQSLVMHIRESHLWERLAVLTGHRDNRPGGKFLP